MKLDRFLQTENLNQLLSLVSAEKRDSIKSFQFISDKQLTLYAELLVRYLICQEFKIPNKEVAFLKSKLGKPYFTSNRFHFNISHSKDAFCVAVSDKQIGVDVEIIRNTNLNIADRFFTAGEIEYIRNGPKRKRLYEIWTKKEAYLKYLGEGLTVPLNSFDVYYNIINCKIVTFEIDNYIISICKDNDSISGDIIKLSDFDMKEIIKNLLRTE